MNKREFKIVAVVMTFALMALALMQGLWLTRLYRQSVERYADQIRAAVTTALYRSSLDSRSVYSVTRTSASVADSLVITRIQGTEADTVQSININLGRNGRSIDMLVLDFGGMPFGAVDSLLCGELAVRGVRDYDVEISLGDKTRRFDHAADTVNGLSHLDGRQCLSVIELFDVA